MIEAHDLVVRYETSSFSLGPLSGRFGDRSLLVAGLAQSGKTTLLKSLCGLIPATSGALSVDGNPVLGGNPRALSQIRTAFGMVFQSDALFDSEDAQANVALPLLRRGVSRAEANTRAREALSQVGLLEHSQALPERLSGGMRKRLGLARAIVARPKYLLADDPLAGLDPGTSQRVLDLLFGLWHGRGGLIVGAADPAPLRDRVDVVLVLDRGKALAFGPTEDVLRDRSVEALFEAGDARSGFRPEPLEERP
jgi:phospholipid/cholesterol/gamma-HCH transport system ATP-binding protein